MPIADARAQALIRARKARGRPRDRTRLPRQLLPDAVALEYAKAIDRLVADAWRLVEDRAFPQLAALLREQADRARADARPKDVNTILEEIASLFFNRLSTSALEQLITRFAERTNDFQRAQFAKQLAAALGVDVFSAEPALGRLVQAFVAENVALIKSVPNRLFDAVEARAAAAVRAGLRWEQLAAELQERLGVAQSDARRIARDQVGKLYSELNHARQKELGVTAYIWRTANDSRVRDAHAKREGKRFTWDNPPAGGHPGSEVLCRCYAEPDFDSLADVTISPALVRSRG